MEVRLQLTKNFLVETTEQKSRNLVFVVFWMFLEKTSKKLRETKERKSGEKRNRRLL